MSVLLFLMFDMILLQFILHFYLLWYIEYFLRNNSSNIIQRHCEIL